MQATQPITTTFGHMKAAFAAIVVAALIVASIVLATMAVPALTKPAGAGSNGAPLQLDPDARGAAGNRGSLVHVAQ